MNRRELLQQAAVGTVAVTAAGCGAGLAESASSTQPVLSAAAGREIVSRLDRSLAYIENLRFVSGELGRDRIASSSSVRTYLEHADPMAKRAIQSLVVAAAAKEIPPGTQPNDEVREAFHRHVALLDEHVLEAAALFHRLPLQDRRRIARGLQADPELPRRVAARIDGLASGIGIHEEARRSVHHAARVVAFRMSKQSPSAFPDEQVAKVTRVAATRGMDAFLMRSIATHGATTAMLQQIAQGTTEGGSVEVQLGAPQPQPVPQPPPQVQAVPAPPPENPDYRRGVVPMAVGGMLLGTGAICLGVAFPLTFLSTDGGIQILGMVGITAGSLLVVGGIIFLIVGGVMAA